jgi:hypothetical protein
MWQSVGWVVKDCEWNPKPLVNGGFDISTVTFSGNFEFRPHFSEASYPDCDKVGKLSRLSDDDSQVIVCRFKLQRRMLGFGWLGRFEAVALHVE